MKVNVEKQPKAQLKISVTVPNDAVVKSYNKILDKKVQNTEIDGFRKGNAPRDKVEQKVGVSTIYGEVINDLLQIYYSQAVKENHIIPISNPKVEVKEFDLKKDFEFIATVATKPDVKIKDYKKELKKYYENKNKEIKKENAEKLKKGEKLEHEHAHIHPNEVIEQILNVTTVEVADILIEEETNRLVARLVDQVVSAGMKVEDYLKAQKTDMDELKKNYSKIAEQNIKAELALNELIKIEKVEVSDDEIMASLGDVDDKTKEQLENPVQKIYIKTILEKNKLISNLIKEIEGENNHE